MKLPEDIKKPLLAVLIGAIATAIGFLAVEAWRPMSVPFWQHVAPSVPTSTLWTLCTLLLVSVILLSAWLIYLHFPKGDLAVRERYTFDPKSYAYRSKRNGALFCNRCLFDSPPIEAPLFPKYPDRPNLDWRCPRCDMHYQAIPPTATT